MAVNEVKMEDYTPGLEIKRDAGGHVTGHVKRANVLLPPGSKVEAVLLVDGVEKARLGPWTAHQFGSLTAKAQMRLRVRDDSNLTKWPVHKKEPVEV